MTSALAGRVRALAGRAAGRLRPASCLIVPVLAAEPVVAAWLAQDSVDFDGAPLHVTAMYPFLPARSIDAAARSAIADLAAGVEPFDFVLARPGQFPGVQYLAPEPAASFVAITERIQRRWPACQPYGGAYDSVMPHVTVAFADEPPVPADVMARDLPIRSRATELWLLQQTPRGWRTTSRFPLGRG
jgi:2'-5' RNA ligase